MNKGRFLYEEKIKDHSNLGVYGIFSTTKVEWKYYVISYSINSSSNKVALTSESKTWISEKLHGRYCLQPQRSSLQYPSFEDPKEALFYELTWG
jgi:hypothetical protein